MLKIKDLIFCPFHKLTGLFCPGCGITRMLLELFKGNFYQAFRYNPLLFIMLPFLLFYLIDLIISKVKKKKPISSKIPNYLLYLLIIIFLLYGVLRNLDFFDYLRPTKIILGK